MKKQVVQLLEAELILYKAEDNIMYSRQLRAAVKAEKSSIDHCRVSDMTAFIKTLNIKFKFFSLFVESFDSKLDRYKHKNSINSENVDSF
jgi:hypothetical protein